MSTFFRWRRPRRAATPGLCWGSRSHRGCHRCENQDRLGRFASPFGEVFAVADGMGGLAGGSRAAEELLRLLERRLRAESGEVAEALCRAAGAADRDLRRRLGGGEAAGATLVLAVLDGRRLWTGHAGDSRAYLLRGERLRRLTRDHSRVQRMIDHSMLTEEEARHHPESGVVTRAFGHGEAVELEVSQGLDLAPGDRLLLCSDGLSGYVDDGAIVESLTAQAEPQPAADRLVHLALEAGGEDNVSVHVVDVAAAGRADPPPEGRDGFGSRLRRWLARAASGAGPVALALSIGGRL